MWSADATLAHRPLTDDAKQWSGVTEGLDPWPDPPRPRRSYAATRMTSATSSGPGRWSSTALPSREGRSEQPDAELPDAGSPTGGRLTREELLTLTAGTHPWHRDRIVDVRRQTVAGVWDDGEHGGIAVLVVEDGRIDREWSTGGTRKLIY